MLTDERNRQYKKDGAKSVWKKKVNNKVGILVDLLAPNTDNFKNRLLIEVPKKNDEILRKQYQTAEVAIQTADFPSRFQSECSREYLTERTQNYDSQQDSFTGQCKPRRVYSRYSKANMHRPSSAAGDYEKHIRKPPSQLKFKKLNQQDNQILTTSVLAQRVENVSKVQVKQSKRNPIFDNKKGPVSRKENAEMYQKYSPNVAPIEFKRVDKSKVETQQSFEFPLHLVKSIQSSYIREESEKTYKSKARNVDCQLNCDVGYGCFGITK